MVTNSKVEIETALVLSSTTEPSSVVTLLLLELVLDDVVVGVVTG